MGTRAGVKVDGAVTVAVCAGCEMAGTSGCAKAGAGQSKNAAANKPTNHFFTMHSSNACTAHPSSAAHEMRRPPEPYTFSLCEPADTCNGASPLPAGRAVAG